MQTELEQRLARLEAAHRELSAQHLALQLTCRMMLPFMGADPAQINGKLQTVWETNNALMDHHRFDEEYQARVRHWLGVLAGEIQGG